MTRTLASLAGALLAAATVTAQGPGAAPPAGERPLVEVAPIQCWWRTSTGAVTLGQPFDVRLTCAVLETEGVQVVPDEQRLTVASVQLKPFEVVGGAHPQDTRSGQRRFFQYRYSVRLIDPDVIGRDVFLPDLRISYKVQSQMGADASLAGRDFTYVMPGIPIRVIAQVPLDAGDIRDGADVGLERVEDLQFRASLFDLASMALAAAGALMAVFALVAIVRRARPARRRERARVSDRRVLAAAGAELARVSREAGGGWTPELVAAGHAALRLVAAVALDRAVSEQPLATGEAPADGRLAVRSWIPGRPGVAVTASATAADLARGLAALPPAAAGRQRVGLEALQSALEAFTVAQYRSSEQGPDGAALVGAVDAGREEASRLGRERLWRRARPAPPPPAWQEGAVRP